MARSKEGGLDQAAAPASAVFPESKQERLICELEGKAGARVFLVGSYVDAQNQYGALIRQDWSAWVD